VAAVPTGDLHEVPLDDLFFSTTDAKGVIDEANEVFTRNARYSREDLIGAPHNIIRHPDMPGGLFQIMWDLLGEHSPVCAYVLNLAGDGSAYWAFATIVPIGDRYLSVRATPCNIEARNLFHALYTQVRAKELKAREKGMSAADAAHLGRDLLVAALDENGFGSYTDLQADLVPEEVTAREAAGPTVPDLSSGSETLQVMVAKAAAARAILGGFNEALTASLGHADALARDVRRCRGALTHLDDTTRALSGVAGGEPPETLVDDIGGASTAVDALAVALTGVTRIRKQLRLSTAIARLQAEAIARYVVAVAGEVEDPRVSERALTSLTEALLAILDADVSADQAATGEFADHVGETTSFLETLRGDADAWRASVADAATGGGAVERLRDLDVAVETLGDIVTRTREHTATFAAATAGLERDRLAAELADIIELAAQV
jgi:aerotaxis receptor